MPKLRRGRGGVIGQVADSRNDLEPAFPVSRHAWTALVRGDPARSPPREPARQPHQGGDPAPHGLSHPPPRRRARPLHHHIRLDCPRALARVVRGGRRRGVTVGPGGDLSHLLAPPPAGPSIGEPQRGPFPGRAGFQPRSPPPRHCPYHHPVEVCCLSRPFGGAAPRIRLEACCISFQGRPRSGKVPARRTRTRRYPNTPKLWESFDYVLRVRGRPSNRRTVHALPARLAVTGTSEAASHHPFPGTAGRSRQPSSGLEPATQMQRGPTSSRDNSDPGARSRTALAVPPLRLRRLRALNGTSAEFCFRPPTSISGAMTTAPQRADRENDAGDRFCV